MNHKRRRSPPPLTEAQLEIMNLVWDQGEMTVAEVWQALSRRRALSRNTVQTQMTRLDERGWLQHRAEGKTFYYRAQLAREATQRDLVRKLIDTAFAGSAEGLVMTLLEDGVSEDEATRIRKMIRQAGRKQK